jgi:RNA polymerase-interacting CarD/CdnL/TRCF family regulator
VTLPVDRASAYLRPLAGESEVAAVAKTLRATGAAEDDSWQRRTKAAKGKLVAGDAVALAEIVRNAVRRDGQATPGGGTIRLSAYERELYLEARQLLAAELGISRGVDEVAADAWIEDQLTRDTTLPQS